MIGRPDDPPLKGDDTEVIEEGDEPGDAGVPLQGDSVENAPFG